jgi:spore photoproduct lyase
MTTPDIIERPRRSKFIRYFDKTPPGIVCPHFHILAHGNGCLFRCAYCYLQLTFRGKVGPTVFTNVGDMLAEVDAFLAREEPAVLNAGELSDALALDDRTGLTKELVPRFAAQGRHLLLLLTKSANVDNLLNLDHKGRTVVSFSVNAADVAAKYELGSPSPAERVAAARRAAQAGYRIRFRLDPVIPVPGWEDSYPAILEQLLEQAPPERVTFGSLRYFPNVKTYARKLGRDASAFDYASEHTAADGRRRVPTPLRLRIYKHLMDLVPAGVETGLCKETEACHRALGIEKVACNCTL